MEPRIIVLLITLVLSGCVSLSAQTSRIEIDAGKTVPRPPLRAASKAIRSPGGMTTNESASFESACRHRAA
mgnify:CR=1 FL=1